MEVQRIGFGPMSENEINSQIIHLCSLSGESVFTAVLNIKLRFFLWDNTDTVCRVITALTETPQASLQFI